jgi:hypothetical protein
MAPSLSPEFRLAAACAMWPPSDCRAETIRAAVAGPLNWRRFLSVARRHQVVGLVHDGLTRTRADVPPEIVREVSAQAATLVRNNLATAVEAVRLQRLFDEANLPVLFLKGASLAVLAFGNLSLRTSKDIDLLVPFETLPAAVAFLARAGYRRFAPPSDIGDARMRLLTPLRKDLGFVQQATGLCVELHWRLFLNPHAMAGASLMAGSRVVSLTGTTALRTLGEEDLFAYLCMHGALHWWNQLKWLADIGALLAAAPEGDVERLIRAAETRDAGRAAAQAMLLCRRLLGTRLPTPLMKKLSKSPKVGWLQETALHAMTTGGGEREPREMRFGTTRGSLSAFFVGRSWRYRLAELRNLLTNETDVLALPLPERLRFLYPILRLPLWVWRHASQRDAK